MTRVGDATMTAVTNLVAGDDKHVRCSWGASTPDYVAYHDTEWGFGIADDHRLFEKLCLEGFQSGLSWLTILRKRENFRAPSPASTRASSPTSTRTMSTAC